jgi:transcriptional regulator with XRE-family HTH domain
MLYGVMSRSLTTEGGLSKLAEVIKQARGSHSYRDFESVTGVSHATIRRLELCEVKSPDVETLEKLSRYTPYSTSELLTIAHGRGFQSASIRHYLIAEDVLPMVNELPPKEAARLAQMIVGKLAGL